MSNATITPTIDQDGYVKAAEGRRYRPDGTVESIMNWGRCTGCDGIEGHVDIDRLMCPDCHDRFSRFSR